ncbi:ATP-dependent zinc metalloprotease FtsH 2 [Penaeus vannamei]|uniref:ATP-dependent zinc metalloprotease FtsH 2 n=1 Tax=Penaeus vannamei TaxID=6689 RepID=A0A423TSA7_PENVA|nr:ATP-dependent zinc metalloprotease FtsH 2 [Penaeus vannamei]
MVHVCEEPETSTQVAKSTQSPSRPAFALFPRVLELGASLQGDGVGFAAVWDNARVLPPGVTRAIATMHVTPALRIAVLAPQLPPQVLPYKQSPSLQTQPVPRDLFQGRLFSLRIETSALPPPPMAFPKQRNPPGAGKTYLVKQMSNVCEMPLYGVHTHQVRGAAQTRKLFEQARDNYPSLVFMDDVDAIFANHDEEPPCTTYVQAIRDELFAQLGPRKLKIVDPKSSKNPTGSALPSPSCSSSGRGVNGVGGGSSRASSRASTMSRPRPSLSRRRVRTRTPRTRTRPTLTTTASSSSRPRAPPGCSTRTMNCSVGFAECTSWVSRTSRPDTTSSRRSSKTSTTASATRTS